MHISHAADLLRSLLSRPECSCTAADQNIASEPLENAVCMQVQLSSMLAWQRTSKGHLDGRCCSLSPAYPLLVRQNYETPLVLTIASSL